MKNEWKIFIEEKMSANINEGNMSPADRFDYKQNWKKNARAIYVHSDLRDEALQWCKSKLKQHQWHFDKLVSSYTDAYYFETVENTKLFVTDFEKAIMD